MATEPCVSVVLPVYNARRYVAQSIRSILNQSFTDFELLVLDDGSTDGSAEIAARYARSDPRLRLIRMEHSGIVPLLNEGLRQSRGKLVARMDADDVALPNRFRDQVDRFRECADLVVLGGQIQQIDKYGLPLGQDQVPLEHEEIERHMLCGDDHFIGHPTTMLRRDAVREAGGYREIYPYAEDLDLWLRLGERGRLANLPQVVLRYRCHIGGVSVTKAKLQGESARACVLDALRRRGLPDRIFTESEPPMAQDLDKAAIYRNWFMLALRHRHWHTAALYAAKACMADPRSFAASFTRRVQDSAARGARRVFGPRGD
jgi:hypothetical protein